MEKFVRALEALRILEKAFHTYNPDDEHAICRLADRLSVAGGMLGLSADDTITAGVEILWNLVDKGRIGRKRAVIIYQQICMNLAQLMEELAPIERTKIG